MKNLSLAKKTFIGYGVAGIIYMIHIHKKAFI